MRRWPLAVLALAGPVLPFEPTHAQQPTAGIVLKIDATASVSVSALRARIAALPSFQRAALGPTPLAAVRRFLDEVVVPEQLVAAAARDEQLTERPSVALAIDRVLSGATVRAIRRRVGDPAAIAADDVRAYYDANRERYETPERYRVWRILCRTRDEAQEVLLAANADPSPKGFAALARDHSQDKATYLRSGDLGFLAEDGTSNEPGLKADPVVVRAARTVGDGELVPQPVPEGDFFAVVSRRGTLPARKRGLDEVAAQVRDAIARQRVKDEADKLITTLRATRLHDHNPSLLDALDLPEPSRARPD